LINKRYANNEAGNKGEYLSTRSKTLVKAEGGGEEGGIFTTYNRYCLSRLTVVFLTHMLIDDP
jgi:hypothetical protein